jgi:hypothetical protein
MEREPGRKAGPGAPARRVPAWLVSLVAPAIAVLVGLPIALGLQPSVIAQHALAPVTAVYEHLVCGVQHAVNDIVDTGSSCH